MTLVEGSRRTNLVAEVMGPPGAGKSTVIDDVARLAPRVRPVRGYRAPRNVPTYVRAAMEVAPLVRSEVAGGRAERRSVRWMVRLQASPRVLQAERMRHDGVVLFDQGPAYTLVRLHRVAPSEADRYDQWWRASLQSWTDLLDVVVLLDAPDDVLLQRIRRRAKAHAVKDIDADAALAALSEYRGRCETVARALANGRCARLVRIDTANLAREAVGAAVLSGLGEGRSPEPVPGATP